MGQTPDFPLGDQGSMWPNIKVNLLDLYDLSNVC